MFAVIKTGGRQFRVIPDEVLEIGKIAGDVGTIVQLGEVLVVGGDTPVLGMPTVAGVTVAAEVLYHKRGPKVFAFKKRRRKNSRRKRGYRDEITEILTDNAQPSIGPRPRPKAQAVETEPERRRIANGALVSGREARSGADRRGFVNVPGARRPVNASFARARTENASAGRLAEIVSDLV